MGVRTPMVVVDRGAIRASGVEAKLPKLLDGLDWILFDGFTPNPRAEDAHCAAQVAASHGSDGVIAIGGGSCLDVAKVAAIACQTPGISEDIARGISLASAEPVPFIAVPTPTGTGSEATHFGAIYVNGRKVSVAHEGMRPGGIILDADLHLTMPAHVAAASGLDALCQAMESLWAAGGTDESRAFARAAGPLIAGNLVSSVLDCEPEARARVMIGAHLAGQAINISKTTASHALSYQFTQRFGLDHGHAVALTIGQIAGLNAGTTDSDCNHPGGAELVAELVGEASGFLGSVVEDLPARVADLLSEIGQAPSLREAGVDRDSLKSLAVACDPVRLGNNPRRLDTRMLLGALERSWSREASVGSGVMTPA